MVYLVLSFFIDAILTLSYSKYGHCAFGIPVIASVYISLFYHIEICTILMRLDHVVFAVQYSRSACIHIVFGCIGLCWNHLSLLWVLDKWDINPRPHKTLTMGPFHLLLYKKLWKYVSFSSRLWESAAYKTCTCSDTCEVLLSVKL